MGRSHSSKIGQRIDVGCSCETGSLVLSFVFVLKLAFLLLQTANPAVVLQMQSGTLGLENSGGLTHKSIGEDSPLTFVS